MTSRTYPVVFAGAGPGDPDLITIKAKEALEKADLIIYAGSLVPEAVLCWKGKETQTLSSAGMNLDQIIETVLSCQEAGGRVVRLHTGDPSFYGAIFEQMRELDKRGVSYEVIPGVTAAFAASAKMNMEFTLPELTQTLILTRISGRTPVPETEALEKLAAHKAALAVYLSIGHVDTVQKIIERHYGETSLCAIAYKVSHPDEMIIIVPACDLAKACRDNNITRHALIIAGKSVAAAFRKTDPRANVMKSKLYDAGFSHGYRTS